MRTVFLRSFGVRFAIAAPADVFGELSAAFPPHAVRSGPGPAARRFFVAGERTGHRRSFSLYGGRRLLCRSAVLGTVAEHLGRALRHAVAARSPYALFVHAGAVGWKGCAIVVPGPSGAGKSELVNALVAGGATYYSDDLAPLDSHGRVFSYRRPLRLRQDGPGAGRCAGTLGGELAPPLPVGLIVCTRYRGDASWSPRELSAGDAALHLLANTLPVRSRPGFSLRTLGAAARGARAVQSERGEAADAAREILSLV